GRPEYLRGTGEGRVEGGGLAVDESDGRPADLLAEEPRLGQPAGTLGPGDSPLVKGDPKVITDAAANRAGDILDGEFHERPLGPAAIRSPRPDIILRLPSQRLLLACKCRLERTRTGTGRRSLKEVRRGCLAS